MRGLFDKVLLSDEDCDSIKELYKDKLVRIEDRNAFPARAHHKYNETDPDSWLHKTVQSLITSNLGDDYYLIQRVTVLRYRINDIFGDHYDGSWNVQSNKLLTENHFYGGVELSNREDFKGGEFYIQGEDVELVKGRLYTHHFDDRHGVKMVQDGVRWSIHFIIDDRDGFMKYNNRG